MGSRENPMGINDLQGQKMTQNDNARMMQSRVQLEGDFL